jgi:ribonuclease BN (tRNA processing enzyme)
MRLTILGCGDAFGSGGRANTCYLLQTKRSTTALDFGATSLVEMKRRGFDPRRLDAIVLSHLHGDHFGGIPFLFLDLQFDCQRKRPFTIVGPVGTRERLFAAAEVFFPGTATMDWRFPLTIIDLPCGQEHALADLSIVSHEVVHPSGAPSTGLRIRSGGRTLAFSGDTEWTESLPTIARDADLFLCECYKPTGTPTYHMSLELLDANRDRLGAKRIMLTHMSPAMLDRTDEAVAKGLSRRA